MYSAAGYVFSEPSYRLSGFRSLSISKKKSWKSRGGFVLLHQFTPKTSQTCVLLAKMSSMITTSTWVPRGFAAPFPSKYDFDEEEFERIASLAKLKLDDANDDLEEAQAGEGSADKDESKPTEEDEKEELERSSSLLKFSSCANTI